MTLMRGSADRMAAMTNPSSHAVDAPGSSRPLRFDLHTRMTHWLNAFLILALMGTGAAMYFTPIGNAIGNRNVVKYVHIVVGLLLPLAIFLPFLGRRAQMLRFEIRALNRWVSGDARWLMTLGARGAKDGKYNAGQKLNSAILAGCLLVLWITGVVLAPYVPTSDLYRTSATFTHDSFALVAWVAVTGHIFMATIHPNSLRAMLRGR